MKKLLLLIFICPLYIYCQIQLGQSINGEQGRLLNDYGASVSSSANGNIIAIGGPLNNVNGKSSGYVQVFENIGGVWTKIGDDIEGDAAEEEFGFSVSLSSDGNIVAIGSIGIGVNGTNSGYVRVFENIGGDWIQIGNDIDGESSADGFGNSVSLSSNGNILAIGARSNDGNGINSGHVRIYENIGGVWTQVGNDIDGEAIGDFSGFSVSLSSNGNIVVIGASFNDGNGSSSGHVRIYENIGGVWTQVGNDIDGEANGDRFGSSVSLSSDGSIVAIGASRNDGNGVFSGHVRIYENIGGIWTQIGDDIDGEDSINFFGDSLSLSSDGSIVAIGATGNDGNGNDSGHVRIYENISGVWTQVGNDIDGEAEEDESGGSVSLSSDGSIVVIGATGNDGNGNDSGHVRIYENISGVWTQVGNDIDGNRTYSADQLGFRTSISLDGNIIAVASNNKDDGIENIQAGQVIIYENIGGIWTQIGNDINGDDSINFFGDSLSLSSDGSIVAIGATGNDGNGNDSGHVRIYENIGGIWTQIGDDIDGEANRDLSGSSLSLSSDGSIVAIGATLNDGNGVDSGHVRVYKNINEVWTQVGNDIDGENMLDQSGESLSLSSDGSIVAIGSLAHDSGRGHIRIFKNINEVWTQIGNNIEGDNLGDRLGFSVSLSSDGSIVALGSRLSDGNNPEIVRVFKNMNDVWTQIGNDIEGEAVIDLFGGGLSLSPDGNIVAIGFRFLDGNANSSGQVRVYQNIGDNWTQLGNYINGEALGDQFGIDLALSANARLIVGSPGNDTNGDNSGQVKIFDLSAVLSSDDFILSQFSLYPNPTKDKVTIELKEGIELQNINIYNSLGQFISSSKNLEVNTSQLSVGLYYLEIETDKGKASKKLIIE